MMDESNARRATGHNRASQRAHEVAVLGLCVGLLVQPGCFERQVQQNGGTVDDSRTAALEGAVVGTVDGAPITLAEVQSLVSASRLSPGEALRRLEAERLLMAAAQRQGLAQDFDVHAVARKARVQALLKAEADAVTITESDLRAAYTKAGARFDRPEARSSVHVLAKLGPNATPEADAAAKAFVEGIIPALADTSDPSAYVHEQNGQKMPLFSVVGEVLPAFSQNAALAKPFLEALFAARAPGVVHEPVRTDFGWHVIRVIDITPRQITPYETAAVMLRQELTATRREQRVKDLIAGLRAQQPISTPEDVGKTLALVPQ